VILFPNKPVCCDGVLGCTCITIHILNIGWVRYIRNLKIVTTFSREGSSVTNCETRPHYSKHSDKSVCFQHFGTPILFRHLLYQML